MKKMKVNGKEYKITRLLGHGKGGYSYLASDGKDEYVLKQIHHEPCSYYQFGNKIEAEQKDYDKLSRAGIRIPKMIAIDLQQERIVKEYVNGPTIYEMILSGQMEEKYLTQVREMCKKLYPLGLNIDYFPTNFVVQSGEIYYIDYECNEYMEEWNFENWGIKYWSKTPEFMDYVNTHEA